RTFHIKTIGMKKTMLILAFLIHVVATAQIAQVTNGAIKTFENFPSDKVAPRNVAVWLPDGYSTAEKYPVLYMHDGQMLFDPSITWNNQAWEADAIASKLMAQNKVQKFI